MPHTTHTIVATILFIHVFLGAVIGLGVTLPFLVLLTVVTIIIIITVVYHVKRRRYRHYQLHRVAMSQLDDEPA